LLFNLHLLSKSRNCRLRRFRAVKLYLLVPRDAIPKTDTRYCDQCHWTIWNTIRVLRKNSTWESRREIDCGEHTRSFYPVERNRFIICERNMYAHPYVCRKSGANI